METVEILIKLPKGYKELIEDIFGDNGFLPRSVREDLLGAVSLGTVLPKGHGNLIDKESLIKAIEQKAKRLENLDTINGLCGAVALAYEAETVIEAYKEEKND